MKVLKSWIFQHHPCNTGPGMRGRSSEPVA